MPTAVPAMTSKVVSASTLAGYRVRSYENEDLGAIEEILIDAKTGRVAYAVLCFGGSLGFGDKLFAIPWDLLRLNARERTLILACGRCQLEGAPAFQHDDWPDFDNETWDREIRDHYRRGPRRYNRTS